MPTIPKESAPFASLCALGEENQQNSCHFRQSGALGLGLQGECVEQGNKQKAPPVWDPALGPRP